MRKYFILTELILLILLFSSCADKDVEKKTIETTVEIDSNIDVEEYNISFTK